MSERLYYEEHTWVSVEDDKATVGLTDYAQNEMGDIIYVELPEVGSSVTEGQPFATLESAKAVQDVIAPLSGEVLQANEELLDVPELINEDPYGAGWLVMIAPEDFDPDKLMDEDEYNQFLSEQ